MRRAFVFIILAATASVSLTGMSLAASNRSQARRTVQVYSAVIRQLVTVDCAAADPSFRAVYVLNGPVPGAGDPNLLIDDWQPSRPFKTRVVSALTVDLDALPTVTFIDDRATVVEGSAPGQVINDGVLVTLGAITDGHRRVEVPASCWINGLSGHWLTYVLERADGQWQVTGTDGPIAIA